MYVTALNATPHHADADDGLEVVGGKGRSLARMAKAGFNVPGGFVITAAAYRSFVATNNLQQKIVSLAKPAVADGRVSFEQASEAIQAVFAEHDLSAEITREISQAYGSLDDAPVAVRSSANAEDLPGLSFAGQQETYLNVKGTDEVVAAVRNCWASLWTPQAISYRHQNGIDQDSVAMAVVVQIMVTSEVSGILFTANPATGERSEIIVNASFGLGEAVVSGQVTPDTYIVDKETLQAKTPASVILSQNDFDKMAPGSILVAPNTTPAWTQLFAHAVGLVTDMGSILAHGSVVAREYGIPAVLGVGNGTVRIKHGQSITIDGDAGSVTLHEEEEAVGL